MSKKQKILIICISVLFSILAVGGITMAFLLGYNNFQPPKPAIMQTDEDIFISMQANDNFKAYRFIFQSEDEEIVIDSTVNVISSNDFLSNGGTLGKQFSISCQYIAENEKNNSKISQSETWLAKSVLAKPQITIDITNNSLSWTKVKNADYYMVYYNDGDLKSTQVSTNVLSLNQLPVGNRNIFVVACSLNSNYFSSKSSNQIDVTVKHSYSQFAQATFTKSTKMLVVQGYDDLDAIEVGIGGNQYTATQFTKSNDGEIYTYQIDLKAIYIEDASVSAKPLATDEFHVFVGQATEADII